MGTELHIELPDGRTIWVNTSLNSLVVLSEDQLIVVPPSGLPMSFPLKEELPDNVAPFPTPDGEVN